TDDRHVGSDDAAVSQEELPLRSRKGLHPDCPARHLLDRVRGQSESAGQHACRVHRLFQSQSGAGPLRQRRGGGGAPRPRRGAAAAGRRPPPAPPPPPPPPPPPRPPRPPPPAHIS